jgi:hypothetical protein
LINKGVEGPNANLVDNVVMTVSNFYPIISILDFCLFRCPYPFLKPALDHALYGLRFSVEYLGQNLLSDLKLQKLQIDPLLRWQGSAAHSYCILNSPWMGENEFWRSFDQRSCFGVPDIVGWHPGESNEFWFYLSSLEGKYGITFIGPNESMLSDSESNHNNNQWTGHYYVARV